MSDVTSLFEGVVFWMFWIASYYSKRNGLLRFNKYKAAHILQQQNPKMLTSLTDKSNKYLRHILSGLENIFYTLLMFSISTCKLTKYAPRFNTGLILIERIANDKDQIQ